MNEGLEAVRWVQSLEKFGIKPGLERMNELLERLNHPERRLKFVHIAGTNGKGSTVEFITSVLMESGYEVGTFTSPGMESFTSRIGYNKQSISDEDFSELVEKMKPHVLELANSEWGSPTEFEVMTVIAILYFATKSYPDVVVWETGLGGRLDSTNVVAPLVSAITNIGYDHMDVLGESLEQIAEEKAGIIKSGVPSVTSEDNMLALDVLIKTAEDRKSSLYRMGRDFSIERVTTEWDQSGEKFHYQGPFARYKDLAISMLGEHQVKNAALAITVLEILRQYYAIYFTYENLLQGLQRAQWPGRFEIVQKDPYVILDGAHNIEGIEALLCTMNEQFKGKKIKLLFSALQDKDITGMVERLAPHCQEVMITGIDHSRAADTANIEMVFRDQNPELVLTTIQDWKEALQLWHQSGQAMDVLLATGSLYFISNIRKELKANLID